MKLITNSDKTHKGVFRKLLKKAHSIDIVTAYSDQETLDFIIKRISKNKNNPKLTLITGGNFAITHPDALAKIKQELAGKLFVALPDEQVVFQSNIYLFKTKNNYHVLIGSAPCTEEALETDMEASVYQKKSKKKKLWKLSRQHIDHLIQSADVHPLTTRFIARYETYYQEINNDPEQAQSAWEDSEILINDINQLKARFKKWKKLAPNAERIVEIEDNYRLARKIQNRIASQKMMTDEEASKYMDRLIGTSGERGGWNVNGLQGSKSEIVNQFDGFRELVRFVRDNREQAPGYVFENCQEYARQIKGVGVNMITEILITYEPRRFPKLNSGLIQKMVDPGSLSIKKSIAKYNGDDYQKYTEIMWDYAALLKIKSMTGVDLFFEDVLDELDHPVDEPELDMQVER